MNTRPGYTSSAQPDQQDQGGYQSSAQDSHGYTSAGRSVSTPLVGGYQSSAQPPVIMTGMPSSLGLLGSLQHRVTAPSLYPRIDDEEDNCWRSCFGR